MKFLYLLENLRVPVLNEAMLLITRLGEETAFLAIALVVFWCVDKKRGYLIMAVGFAGTILNQFLKLWFRIPRPWVLDPSFTILEQAREAASGYSFPSGHTQMAVGTFGSLAVTAERRTTKTVCWTLALLVAFSRMYIGVHTPYDVGVSLVLALILIFAMGRPVMEGRGMAALIGLIALLALGLYAFVSWYPFPADVDGHNLESGMKNAATMAGCVLGVILVYPLERKYVNFDTKATPLGQIAKVLLGVGAVLAVKEGLRAPLEALLPVYPARAVRYFLIVMTAGVLWPMSFRWLSRLGVKK